MKDYSFTPAPEKIAEEHYHFHEEEFPLRLSLRDAVKVAEALEDPPAPNERARLAAKRFRSELG